MGYALAKGFVESKIATKDEMLLSEKSQSTVDNLKTEGFTVTSNSVNIWEHDVVILAVKPNCVMGAIDFTSEKKKNTNTPFIMSICAGISIKYLETLCRKQIAIVRVMPNTCCLVGCGASTICGSVLCTPGQLETAKMLMQAVGTCIEVEESDMNIVTGLSGSGPAYVFSMIEAMTEGGIKG
eukprot:GHVL01018329.1.p1 GENE.GHVL01018329.1~~GHVL01018329.1.p1  ORF type:complete len:197 (+),score=28.61 GHVL01018329.1:48-593(+)